MATPALHPEPAAPDTAAAAHPVVDTEASATVLLVGNPNVGKTTIFNALTGQRGRVGNYPGVTVELRSGKLRLPKPRSEREDHRASGDRPSVGREHTIRLVDVPGCYSLNARSAEEQIALNSVLGLGDHPPPALVVVVVDASQLARNLYLAQQLLELRVPTVVALNLLDEAGDPAPDPARLEQELGVPCVGLVARRRQGLDELRGAIERALGTTPRPRRDVRYPEALRADIDRIAEALPTGWRGSVERSRALALWALLSLDDDDELQHIPDALRERCRAVRDEHAERDLDGEVIRARYTEIERIVGACLSARNEATPVRRVTERLDRVLLHPLLGFFIFVALMLVLFQALFSWSDPAIGAIETVFAATGDWLGSTLPEGLLRDVLVDGVIGGVGNVVVFLPQILLLFLFIGLLEDSGYMARVAYLMDRIMRTLGLHGRAFVPMLSGFACAVPAILSTRTMERQRDRLLTMLVVPLMTCSARLPVYTLIIAALFPPTDVFGWVPVQGLLMVAMYLFSVVIALLAAAVLGRTVVRGRSVPLILELPPYRLPRIRATLQMMWERASLFLREAGSVILVCTIALWALLTFPRQDPTPVTDAEPQAALAAQSVTAPNAPTTPNASATTAPPAAAPNASTDAGTDAASQALEQSYAGRLGKALEPVLEPLGFDWKIGVGIIGAFAAREVFISTMGLVYGIGEVDDDATPLRDRIRAETRSDGKPVYTPLSGLSLMVFFALACQCMSTLAVVRRETRSWRWPAFLFVYMTALAYGASLIVYQGGQLLGFS